MSLLEEFKNHTSIALLFLVAGFGAGLGTYKYLSGFFNADVVLHDSYVYKSDIEKTHVPNERYSYVVEQLKNSKAEVETLKKQSDGLLASQSAMAVSVCQRYANEANAIIAEQRHVETSIQVTLTSYGFRDEKLLQADAKRAEELRKYSELLNQQLIQIRGEISKCGK
jgi:hypothetical protein